MREYYYLISSLPDPELDSQKKSLKMDEYLAFCEEQLHEKDNEDLKKLFIFNDIINIVSVVNENSVYKSPSFYSRSEFNTNIQDYSTFFPFIEIYLDNKKNDKRLYPDLIDIDELITLFYENIDSCTDNKFLKKYFMFELDLKNICNSISFQKLGITTKNAFIPFGDAYERLSKSMSLDHGLVPMLDKLIENANDLVASEKLIDEIRWLWFDDEVAHNYFSFAYIISYTVKLIAMERWASLTEEAGKSVLDGLVDKIKSGIQFSDEFLKTGGKR